jgi:hypothetical protein
MTSTDHGHRALLWWLVMMTLGARLGVIPSTAYNLTVAVMATFAFGCCCYHTHKWACR